MKKLLCALLITTLCLTGLTACGGGSTGTETDTAAATEGETTGNTEIDAVADDTAPAGAAADDTAADSTDNADDTASAGVLTVGTNAEFPPFEYIGDDGQPDGFDMGLVRAIGEKLGREVVIENLEFDTLVTAIGSKIDIAAAGMTITEERQKNVDFSDPYYEAVQYVILPAGSDIKTAAQLEGLKIGVQLGTTGDFIVQDEIPGAEAVQFKKGIDAVNDLLNGRVDCVIIDKNPALVFENNHPDEIFTVDGADFGFTPESYAIALPKGDTELAEQINTALAEIKADGTFDELVKTYIE